VVDVSMVEVGGLDGLTLGPVLPRAKENFHTTPALSVVFFAWMGGLFGGVLSTFAVVNGWWWYSGDAAGGFLSSPLPDDNFSQTPAVSFGWRVRSVRWLSREVNFMEG